MVFTIEKFCCLSLKFGSNIVAICGVLLSFFANFDHGIVGSILFRNIALGLCMLYFGSSILLLIGVNKDDYKLMVPWLVFQAVLTIFFLTTTLLNLNVIILLLGLFSAYCLLCVWSLLIKLIEDAGKKEADTGIELFSEPRQLILDTPLNIINLVPQQNNIQQPLDLPPSYNVIMERSSIPCVVPIDDSTLLYKTPVD